MGKPAGGAAPREWAHPFHSTWPSQQTSVEALTPSAFTASILPGIFSHTLAASALSLPPCSPPCPFRVVAALPLAPELCLPYGTVINTLCQEPHGARIRAVFTRSPASGTGLGLAGSLCGRRHLPEAPHGNKLWTEITVRPWENATLWNGKLIFFNFNQHLHENYL